MSEPTVLVAGAGIGGLVLALSLRKNCGVTDIEVFEQSPLEYYKFQEEAHGLSQKGSTSFGDANNKGEAKTKLASAFKGALVKAGLAKPNVTDLAAARG